jgi:hypothetical protein
MERVSVRVRARKKSYFYDGRDREKLKTSSDKIENSSGKKAKLYKYKSENDL